MAQDDVTGLFQIVCPLLAGRIVQADDEVAGSGTVEAVGDFFPRCQQIAEGNEARIGDQRRTEQGRTGAGSGHAGNDDDVDVVIGSHFVHDAGHAVNPGIAAGYDGHGLPLLGPVPDHAAAFDFFGHARRDEFFIRKIMTYQINIGVVTDDAVAAIEDFPGLQGHALQGTRSDADDINTMFHNLSPFNMQTGPGSVRRLRLR